MNYYNEDYLIHYGVKGMKWGVRRAMNVASTVYRGVNKHGENVLEKKARQNDYRSDYHASRGNKLRAKYYDRKAYKNRDRKYDDVETFRAGFNDVAVKTLAAASAVGVGASYVRRLFR